MGHGGLSEVASSLDALLPTDMMLGQLGSKKVSVLALVVLKVSLWRRFKPESAMRQATFADLSKYEVQHMLSIKNTSP